MNDAELRRVAEEAARDAVRRMHDEGELHILAAEAGRAAAKATLAEVGRILGVDFSSIDSIRELQKDFTFMQQARQGREEIARWTKRTVITAIVAAALLALWQGVLLAARAKGGA